MNHDLYICKACGVIAAGTAGHSCPACGHNPDHADWKKPLRIDTADIRDTINE